MQISELIDAVGIIYYYFNCVGIYIWDGVSLFLPYCSQVFLMLGT